MSVDDSLCAKGFRRSHQGDIIRMGLYPGSVVDWDFIWVHVSLFALTGKGLSIEIGSS